MIADICAADKGTKQLEGMTIHSQLIASIFRMLIPDTLIVYSHIISQVHS